MCRRSPAFARLVVAGACFALCAAVSSRAHAYSTPDAYAEQPVLGGGGGRWFSGSPADGFGCGVCHTAAPGQRSFPLYVAGLPAKGYAPAQRQEINLSWPEFAARWAELRPNPALPVAAGAPSPAIGLVAELVAESGEASGTIEIDSANPGPDELCEMTRPNLKPRLAAKLYQVRPGVAPRLIRPDATGVLRCESLQLAQRCIVAMSSCGSKALRFSWTAPSTWEGPIWFSAGFVASEALSGTPAQDAIDEVSVPVVQADSKHGMYRELLRSSCALVEPRARAGSPASVWCFALAGVALLHRRRGLRELALFAPFTLFALFASACRATSAEVDPSAYPSAGLYTPGSTLGVSDSPEVPAAGAGLGDRCLALPPLAAAPASAPTTGKLEVRYTTQSLGGRYAPKNCTAVWLETADGKYVATIELGAGLRKPGLVYFQDHACTERLGPDVVTSATLADHAKPHMATWEGLDFESKPVADGAYKLFIEVTESDKEPGELVELTFDKGPLPFDIVAPVDVEGPLTEVKLKWTLTSQEGGGSAGAGGG